VVIAKPKKILLKIFGINLLEKINQQVLIKIKLKNGYIKKHHKDIN